MISRRGFIRTFCALPLLAGMPRQAIRNEMARDAKIPTGPSIGHRVFGEKFA